MFWASLAFWKRRVEKPLWLFLACMGAPLFTATGSIACHSRVQPNWPSPRSCRVLPGRSLLAERPRMAKAVLVAGLALGLPVVALLHDTSLLNNLVARLPGDVDIAHRTDGWRETAQAVEQERNISTPTPRHRRDYGATGLYSLYSPAARAAVALGETLVYASGAKKPATSSISGTNTITAISPGRKRQSTLTTLRRTNSNPAGSGSGCITSQ